MKIFRKNDQYYLIINAKIRHSDGTEEVLSPETGRHFRVKVGDKLLDDTQMLWDSLTQKWLFQITQEETTKYCGHLISYQGQYKIDGDFPIIIGSDVKTEKVEESIILEAWL